VSYLMAGQMSELERLRLQSRVWEPAGQALLQQLDASGVRRALDIGCGAMGWLRVLAKWIGPAGTIVGTDIDAKMLEAADAFVQEQQLKQVKLEKDDLFSSRLEPASFDLTHARFQIAPLGRGDEQLVAYLRLTKAGGLIVLEDPDTGLLTAPLAAEGQQPTKAPRVGYILPSTGQQRNEPFWEGLRELGYVEGRNIVTIRRYAEGRSERYPALAGELVRHARYFTLQLAESHLTRRLFRQIVARIERLAWHPT